MSGFFAVRADSFWGSVRKLSNGGFKILLDLLVSDPHMRHREIPFRFRERRTGESKLDLANSWQFLCFVFSTALGGALPVNFVSFLIVGASGVIIHFATLYPALWFQSPFAIAQLGAALVASTWNFVLNNVLTFRDRRLRGWQIIPGYAKYLAIASVGIAANVAVATTTIHNLHGLVALSALAGIAVDAVWKYFMSNFLVWRKA
jgi:dolichol-phosphate mannosyltransferase